MSTAAHAGSLATMALADAGGLRHGPESTTRLLGIEVEDALSIAEHKEH
ncbi:MAG: hypothetical protein Q8L49_07350 [Burkholderiaceae bacterium]|nr:hypothetical protein [Burkholderiaceae bacterium]